MIAETLTPLIRPHLDQLTHTEQQLVKALTLHPSAGLYMSASALASSAGVHPSSAVRLAKKLGFEGYPEFRRALQENLSQPTASAALRIERTVAATADGNVLEQLVRKEMNALDQVADFVSQAQLEQAAKAVMGARNLMIWASGNAKVIAGLLDRRLRRAGYACHNIASEGRELAERLVPLRAGDVLVCFAFRREPTELASTLMHARQSGATSILIADNLAHTLVTQADITLAAPRGEDEEFLTLTVPMLITNALVLTVARNDQGRSVQGLQRLDDLYGRMQSQPRHDRHKKS
jgi:DNA-binding MurR/RpiR family transcriptional regulator